MAESAHINRAQAMAMYQVLREANPWLPPAEFVLDSMQLTHDTETGTFLELRMPVALPEDWWNKVQRVVEDNQDPDE